MRICECESVMNSRPLTYISEEQELKTLIPSMFLHDISLDDVPDLDQIEKTNIVLRCNVTFNEDLKVKFIKHEEHPELLRQLALEIIINISPRALVIYTDGSKSDSG
ncbi:bel12-ag transposon polyprotein [Caerostris extrusa]|uniref:Bel12-ag transposon polyprotein n=1 Tax=Caerostris extrusa TaxID=172846 RepID=A0AAV4QCK8_CAEEX|nr:bel12-ag transposon polyprotein [Caerostris extrusa]